MKQRASCGSGIVNKLPLVFSAFALFSLFTDVALTWHAFSWPLFLGQKSLGNAGFPPETVPRPPISVRVCRGGYHATPAWHAPCSVCVETRSRMCSSGWSGEVPLAFLCPLSPSPLAVFSPSFPSPPFPQAVSCVGCSWCRSRWRGGKACSLRSFVMVRSVCGIERNAARSVVICWQIL